MLAAVEFRSAATTLEVAAQDTPAVLDRVKHRIESGEAIAVWLALVCDPDGRAERKRIAYDGDDPEAAAALLGDVQARAELTSSVQLAENAAGIGRVDRAFTAYRLTARGLRDHPEPVICTRTPA